MSNGRAAHQIYKAPKFLMNDVCIFRYKFDLAL